jgi:hypothetical protein
VQTTAQAAPVVVPDLPPLWDDEEMPEALLALSFSPPAPLIRPKTLSVPGSFEARAAAWAVVKLLLHRELEGSTPKACEIQLVGLEAM